MKCCGFGVCSFSYIYILFTVVLFFFKSSVLSFSELSSNQRINIFGIEPVILGHGLMKLIVEYLGYIIYGGIFFYIFRLKKIFKKKANKNNKELIFKKRELSFRIIKLLLITCCIFAIQLIIRNIMNFLNLWMLDLWIFNIIFISYFMKKILNKRIYKHQLLSLGINFGVNLILLITASSIKVAEGNSEYSMIINNFGHFCYILIFYLVFLALSAMICLSQVMQKQLMDIENVSPFSILFIIGIFSTFFTFIALVITSNVKCSEFLKNNGLCYITQIDDENNAAYFDNFKIFINNLKIQYNNSKKAFFIEIFLVYPIYSLACYLKYFCETLIIYFLNPNYVLISDNTYYGVRMIVGLIYNPSDKGTYFKLVGEIISLFTYFFYLEIIELKCCNMNYNTRIKIDERSQSESLGIILGEDDDDDDDDDALGDNTSNTKEKEMVCMQEICKENYNNY